MLSKLLLLFVLIFSIQVHAQSRFEFGYSFGANATTSRTIKSDNMTWGYYTPPLPSTWTNHWSVGYGTNKNRFYLAYDGGALGPTWVINAYPNKFPYSDKVDYGSQITNWSRATGFNGQSRRNSNLLKFSILYKHTWYQKNKFLHKSTIGLGYLKTRANSIIGNSTNFGTYFYANDTLGWINHGMILDKYEYFRNQNIYLIFGYELTYKITNRLNWNAQIMYNQGLYKMIRWHTYRTYSESLTGYSEFDEQWSFTKLSYFAFLTGLTYELSFKKQTK